MIVTRKGVWAEVMSSARTTVGKGDTNKEPSNRWKKQILLAEHSPIRQLTYKWKWCRIPYWVSVHFVRHWLGILHFVSTSRTDRTGIDRAWLTQDNPVNHECEANSQALISISRKRLCNKASKETREAWQEVVKGIKEVDPEMASVMVRECVYRGFCPEFSTCGYSNTVQYDVELKEYRGV